MLTYPRLFCLPHFSEAAEGHARGLEDLHLASHVPAKSMMRCLPAFSFFAVQASILQRTLVECMTLCV